VNGEFTIEYVELPNGRKPAREFVDSLDDKAAARIDAFIERLRIDGNRMQGKFVKKLTDEMFELRVKQFDRIFRVLFFYQPGMLIVITSGFQKKTEQTPPAEIARAERRLPGQSGDCQGREAKKALDEVPKPLHGIAKGKGSYPEGVGL
jgi:phage-related protein